MLTSRRAGNQATLIVLHLSTCMAAKLATFPSAIAVSDSDTDQTCATMPLLACLVVCASDQRLYLLRMPIATVFNCGYSGCALYKQQRQLVIKRARKHQPPIETSTPEPCPTAQRGFFVLSLGLSTSSHTPSHLRQCLTPLLQLLARRDPIDHGV